MRIVPVVALALLPAGVLAQQPDAVPDAVHRDVLALEQRIGQANFDCDYRFFAEVEGAEFIFTGPTGRLTTRSEDLAGEKDCKPRTGSYQLDEVRMMGYGDVVVFNAVAITKTTSAAGEERTGRQRFTDVLVRRNGRWQLVAGHSSRMP